MKKRALILGITGQDGSYLAELLLSKDYEVFGLVRRNSSFEGWWRVDKIKNKIVTFYGDITDPFSIMWALKKSNPDEVYHLAAQSHVQVSWENPYYTAQATAIGVLNLLEAIRVLDIKPKIYNAATSELYSGVKNEAPQNEDTKFNPVSPYGTAKLFGFQIAKNYREAYGMFICNGILFNHESERRGDNFVTQKIIKTAKAKKELHLGNVDAKRDWGYAPEFVEAMWLMLQKDFCDDYVIATGRNFSVMQFVEWVREELGEDFKVYIDPAYQRPKDVEELCGDSKKAKRYLNWQAKITGKNLVKKMIYGDSSK